MARRNRKGQFIKGVSGNPSGKSKPLKVIDQEGRSVEVREYYEKVATLPGALDIEDFYKSNSGMVALRLWELIFDPKTTSATRLGAIKEFNNRGLGPVARHIVTEEIQQEEEFDFSDLPIEVQAKLVSAIEAKGKLGED